MSGNIVLRVAVVLVLLAGVPAYGGGCPDGDGDSVCDDVDNCPAVANADQSDIDGDLAGDVCDPADAALALKAVKLKANTSLVSYNGSVKVKGTFTVAPPADFFYAAGGLQLRVQDTGAGFEQTYIWPQAHCGMVQVNRWLCLAPGVKPTMTGKIWSSTNPPALYRFSLTVKNHALGGAFIGPATVTISQDAYIDRTGTLSNCKGSNTKLSCKP